MQIKAYCGSAGSSKYSSEILNSSAYYDNYNRPKSSISNYSKSMLACGGADPQTKRQVMRVWLYKKPAILETITAGTQDELAHSRKESLLQPLIIALHAIGSTPKTPHTYSNEPVKAGALPARIMWAKSIHPVGQLPCLHMVA